MSTRITPILETTVIANSEPSPQNIDYTLTITLLLLSILLSLVVVFSISGENKTSKSRISIRK
ncbi:MAG: hypothetical protein QW551_01795 [Desulfurococcaceae archaeon]